MPVSVPVADCATDAVTAGPGDGSPERGCITVTPTGLSPGRARYPAALTLPARCGRLSGGRPGGSHCFGTFTSGCFCEEPGGGKFCVTTEPGRAGAFLLVSTGNSFITPARRAGIAGGLRCGGV